jgi:hypothetical protein
MKKTSDLIVSLSRDAKTTNKCRSPYYWFFRLFVVLAIYAIGCQIFLGLRPDLLVQFTRLLFVLEILLLILLFFSGIIASILVMYPDVYQIPKFLNLPYVILLMLITLLGFQLLIFNDPRMSLTEGVDVHSIECGIFIGVVGLIPSALMFALILKGAPVRQLQAGIFVVLTTSSIGCFTLRLAEFNDSIIHLLQWHYATTLLLTAIGALIGKWLLKW